MNGWDTGLIPRLDVRAYWRPSIEYPLKYSRLPHPGPKGLGYSFECQGEEFMLFPQAIREPELSLEQDRAGKTSSFIGAPLDVLEEKRLKARRQGWMGSQAYISQ